MQFDELVDRLTRNAYEDVPRGKTETKLRGLCWTWFRSWTFCYSTGLNTCRELLKPVRIKQGWLCPINALCSSCVFVELRVTVRLRKDGFLARTAGKRDWDRSYDPLLV
jgi:hypothetical protein